MPSKTCHTGGCITTIAKIRGIPIEIAVLADDVWTVHESKDTVDINHRIDSAVHRSLGLVDNLSLWDICSAKDLSYQWSLLGHVIEFWGILQYVESFSDFLRVSHIHGERRVAKWHRPRDILFAHLSSDQYICRAREEFSSHSMHQSRGWRRSCQLLISFII